MEGKEVGREDIGFPLGLDEGTRDGQAILTGVNVDSYVGKEDGFSVGIDVFEASCDKIAPFITLQYHNNTIKSIKYNKYELQPIILAINKMAKERILEEIR